MLERKGGGRRGKEKEGGNGYIKKNLTGFEGWFF